MIIKPVHGIVTPAVLVKLWTARQTTSILGHLDNLGKRAWVRNIIIPPSTAYLVFSWVKDMTTVVALNVGEDLVALAGNVVPIGRAEELVASGKRRHVVGVTGDVSKSVRHGDRGKRRRSC